MAYSDKDDKSVEEQITGDAADKLFPPKRGGDGMEADESREGPEDETRQASVVPEVVSKKWSEVKEWATGGVIEETKITEIKVSEEMSGQLTQEERERAAGIDPYDVSKESKEAAKEQANAIADKNKVSGTQQKTTTPSGTKEIHTN